MMHATLPILLAAVLIGCGAYGVLARRNAVLVLIGVELMLNGANLLLVTLDAFNSSALRSGSVLTLFTITIAAAEICVALAVILAMFRLRGDVDMTAALEEEADPADVLAAQAMAQPEEVRS